MKDINMSIKQQQDIARKAIELIRQNQKIYDDMYNRTLDNLKMLMVCYTNTILFGIPPDKENLND